MTFSQTFMAEAARQIAAGQIERPIFEIVAVSVDKSILVRFADAAAPIHNGPTARFFDRYDMEVDVQKLATATGREIEWFDLTPDGRGSKIRNK